MKTRNAVLQVLTRLAGLILVFVGVTALFIPFVLVHLFKGIDRANYVFSVVMRIPMNMMFGGGIGDSMLKDAKDELNIGDASPSKQTHKKYQEDSCADVFLNDIRIQIVYEVVDSLMPSSKDGLICSVLPQEDQKYALLSYSPYLHKLTVVYINPEAGPLFPNSTNAFLIASKDVFMGMVKPNKLYYEVMKTQ